MRELVARVFGDRGPAKDSRAREWIEIPVTDALLQGAPAVRRMIACFETFEGGAQPRLAELPSEQARALAAALRGEASVAMPLYEFLSHNLAACGIPPRDPAERGPAWRPLQVHASDEVDALITEENLVRLRAHLGLHGFRPPAALSFDLGDRHVVVASRSSGWYAVGTYADADAAEDALEDAGGGGYGPPAMR